ncbi:unnamed protein product [Phaeothamnion confervicola]
MKRSRLWREEDIQSSRRARELRRCPEETKANSAAIAAMLESQVHANKSVKSTQLQASLKAAGFEADRRHVNNAKLRVKKDMALGEDDSCQLMEPFLKAFEEKNSGSVISLQKDEKGRLKRRCLIMPNACAIAAYRTPKQLLMIEGRLNGSAQPSVLCCKVAYQRLIAPEWTRYAGGTWQERGMCVGKNGKRYVLSIHIIDSRKRSGIPPPLQWNRYRILKSL